MNGISKITSKSATTLCKKAVQLLKERAYDASNLSSNELKELTQELHIHQIELEMQNEEMNTTNEELNQTNEELNQSNKKLLHTQGCLEDEKEKYHDLFNTAPVAYMLCNDSGIIINANKALTEMLNVEKIILINTSFPRFSAPAFRDTYYFHIKDVIREGGTQNCEMELLRDDGESIYVNIESSFEKYTNENKLIRSVIVDITERNIQMLENLRISELKYRNLLAFAPDGMLISNIKGEIEIVNKQLQKMTGYAADELIGQPVEMLVPKRFTKHEQHRSSYATNPHFRMMGDGVDLFIQHKDGSEIPVEISLSSIKTAEGLIVSVSIRDVSERKQIEETLRLSEEKYVTAFRAVPDLISISKLEDSVFIEVNEGAEKIFGYERDELIGHSALRLGLWVDVRQRQELVKIVKEKGKAHEKEVTFRKKNDDIRTLLFSAAYIEVNHEACMLFLASDITDRKLAEKELKVAHENQRKLAARLDNIREEERAIISREIHDEFGTAFSLLNLDLAWLQKKLPDDDEIYEKINSMMLNSRKNADLVRKIASNLRPAVLDDLGLDAAIEWYCSELNKSIEFTYSISGKIPNDTQENIKTALYRIFQEAMTNIIRHAKADKIQILLKTFDDQIEMIVRDNGIGIDESTIDNSNNLGLLGIRERANQYGGNITIGNHDEGGVQINVYIPTK